MKLRIIGIFFLLAGLMFAAIGGVLTDKANAGLNSLDAVYTAQNLHLSYDDNGNFVDRGSVETGNAILSLLEDDWAYPLNRSNLDSNDTLINTSDELMVQYAIISYHILNGTQTIVLEEDVEYKGVVYEAGTYEFKIDGRYWTDFDRKHPIEGPARSQAWSATAHGLLAEISVGVAADYQATFAQFMGIMIMLFGGVFVLGGASFVLVDNKKS